MSPTQRLGIFMIPLFNLGIRPLMTLLCIFDIGGAFFFDYGLGFDHAGHLGGYAAGLLLYVTVCKRLSYTVEFLQYLRAFLRWVSVSSKCLRAYGIWRLLNLMNHTCGRRMGRASLPGLQPAADTRCRYTSRVHVCREPSTFMLGSVSPRMINHWAQYL